VRRTYIREVKAGGRIKMRPLGIPAISDRIVQEALRMILEPIWEADFSRHSYGFRPNRSTKDAVAYLGARLTSSKGMGYGWIIEGDIQSFFDTISHQKLMRLVRQRIRDKRILSLVWKFLLEIPLGRNYGTREPPSLDARNTTRRYSKPSPSQHLPT
jgi:RNA-directed DNA polymerase